LTTTILLKVHLNTITLTSLPPNPYFLFTILEKILVGKNN